MGMPEIQEAPRPSNPWVPMGATVVETGTDALGSLGNRSQGIAFMNGSWMSREVHVQFWERVGVQLPCATHLPIYAAPGILPGWAHRRTLQSFSAHRDVRAEPTIALESMIDRR